MKNFKEWKREKQMIKRSTCSYLNVERFMLTQSKHKVCSKILCEKIKMQILIKEKIKH